MLLASLLLAPVLAGCAQPAPEAPPGTPATAGALSIPWGLTDCLFVVFAVPVDPARLAPHLPEGFTPAVGGRLPFLPQGAADSAFLGMEAFQCPGGLGLDGPLQDLDYGSYFTFVTPPDALRNGSIESYFVKWDVLVPDAPRREALAARGVPARAGEAEVALTRAANGVQLRAALRMEGAGGFTLTGAGVEGAGGDGFPFVEYAPAAGGTLAAWRAVAQERASAVRGNGVVEVEPGSWVAEVMGDTRAPVSWSAGTWTFADGAVTHPVSTIADVR